MSAPSWTHACASFAFVTPQILICVRLGRSVVATALCAVGNLAGPATGRWLQLSCRDGCSSAPAIKSRRAASGSGARISASPIRKPRNPSAWRWRRDFGLCNPLSEIIIRSRGALAIMRSLVSNEVRNVRRSRLLTPIIRAPALIARRSSSGVCTSTTASKPSSSRVLATMDAASRLLGSPIHGRENLAPPDRLEVALRLPVFDQEFQREYWPSSAPICLANQRVQLRCRLATIDAFTRHCCCVLKIVRHAREVQRGSSVYDDQIVDHSKIAICFAVQ